MYRPLLRTLSFVVAVLSLSVARGQTTSVRPGINKSYEKPDVAKAVERFERKDRDVVQKLDEILAACDLRPGMAVADIGAGTGLLSRPMAAKVAPGTLYAVDITEPFLAHIAKTAKEQKLGNLQTVLATAESANLPRQSVDLALVCDAYHHFEFPQKSLASIFDALRPGGRLVLVEMHKQGPLKDHVRMDKKTALAEVADAGFVLVDERDLGPTQYVARFEKRAFRPPAVPLVVHDPYFSIWSESDALAGDWSRHWTGAVNALCSMVKIDGKVYRLMGMELREAPAMKQVGLEVLPTRTIYDFEDAGVHLRLTFTTPTLPTDLDLVSRPATYLAWQVRAIDGREHEVAIYYDNSAELVVDKPEQPVRWSRPKVEGLAVLAFGSEEQPVLKKKGDNLRIDWGHLYVAVPAGQASGMVVTDHKSAREGFAAGKLPETDDARMPRPAKDEWPVAACQFNIGRVSNQPVERRLILAYDDEYSIEYLGTKLRPYWRRKGMDAAGMLQAADRDYTALVQRCEAFDRELVADLIAVGGRGYADLCSLAYREAFGGHKLCAAPDGRPMYFPKENFSNGCIATVDIVYPAAPIFALLSNDLLKATVTPVFDYAMTERWKFPFAPHDVGTYPLANGQVYGGGERTEENQMPVEESGNMILVAALISQIDGNTEYVKPYWPLLKRWAEYLRDKGLDPENQLCTDDFAGHLAHNANLSLKAILALAAYGRLCEMAGKPDEAAEYRKLAKRFAEQWVKMADDGDHYRLAFDKPGSWSQKYNLVWDKLLGLKLFPDDVAKKEIAFYRTKLDRYGLPLDNRENYTKTDWQVWTATLADNRGDFDALMRPVRDFINSTQPRVPLTDWYFARDAKMRGFQARPVIGGVFIKTLDEPAVWKKWSRAAK